MISNNNECKICQDLLPNYIDGLTCEETSHFVEEHINTCQDCKNIFENMKKNLDIDVPKATNAEISFLKKFNKKMNILKLIILIIVITFILINARKLVIFMGLSQKASQYNIYTNYKVTQTVYDKENSFIIESYNKDGKALINLSLLSGKKDYKLIEFYDNNKTTSYIEADSKKFAVINSQSAYSYLTSIKSLSHYDMKNIILNIFFTSITSTKCNGQNCYYIVDSQTGYTMYINKETGLPVRIISSPGTINSKTFNQIIDYDIEFDVVTDADMIEPDINEYEIQ